MSLADFASGEAQKQYGSVKCAVLNPPTRLLVEGVNQRLTNLTGSRRSAGTARQQREQIIGSRGLYVAVRFERLHSKPRCGHESRQFRRMI